MASQPSIDLLFRAFSDRTRLRLLGLLRDGETCVCDLVAVLKLSQPKVSRHLAYLRRAGLVVARRQGLWSHYRLASPRRSIHTRLLECLACCGHDLPELADDAAALARIKKCKADSCC